MAGRNHEVKIRLSKEELEKLKRKAAEVSMNMGQFVRFVCLSARVSTEKLNGSKIKHTP